MASIGIHTPGSHPTGLPFSKSEKIYPPVYFLPISNRGSKFRAMRVQTSNSSVSFTDPDGVYLKRTDSWISESVTEIVKNLPKAPLLIQIHATAEISGRHEIQIDEAIEEEWAAVKIRWQKGECKSPEGVIFVGELKEEEEDPVTRGWGVIVQGRGAEGGPACYLLKTDKARGGRGMDHCIHFCLMRTNNLMTNYLEQFKDSWLLKKPIVYM